MIYFVALSYHFNNKYYHDEQFNIQYAHPDEDTLRLWRVKEVGN